MKQFHVEPMIVQFATAEEFINEYKIGEGDLLFISNSTYGKFFEGKVGGAHILNYRNYVAGEPTDIMVENIYKDICDLEYSRVIAVGGGTILDVAKLFALKTVTPVVDLYEKKIPAEKEKELILVPTTCGTGSEVTNISILELTAINTKMGLAVDELYADTAVLIPELLMNLPFHVFAASSIDALIHSIESFTSPKANPFTKIFSEKAMRMILSAYMEIRDKGEEARYDIIEDVLTASTYAGIAFGNAGCAAVHAMSYPLGATYHVPHGEANYAMFTAVYKKFMTIDPDGDIKILNAILAEILGCAEADVYEEIEKLLDVVLPKKSLSAYGVKPEEVEAFTENVMTKQGRLMANNYVELSREDVFEIYSSIYA